VATICLWGAHRLGLLRRNPGHSLPTVPAIAPPSAKSSAPSTNPPPAEQSKVADSNFTFITSLEDAYPSTFIAERYDKARVIFGLGKDGDFRIEDPEQLKTFHPLPDPGALRFEIDPAVFETVKQHYQEVSAGDQWQLEVAPGVRFPVIIQKPIGIRWMCSSNDFTAGFIAEVAGEFQPAFAAAPQEYFLVHKALWPADSQSRDKPLHVAELKDWNPAPEIRSQIEAAITAKVKEEIAVQYVERWDQNKPEQDDGWKQFVDKTAAGQGRLTYELQAFQLSPDGVPRVFARAKWMIEKDRAFLMSMWLRVGPRVTFEAMDQEGTKTDWVTAEWMREHVDPMRILETLGTVVNVFDRPDGYGDVLMYMQGYESYGIVLYHYNASGLFETPVSIGDGC
jgi:hypothetical protein